MYFCGHKMSFPDDFELPKVTLPTPFRGMGFLARNSQK